MQNLLIPWSDNWWIEKGKAWFCAGEIGALFCVNMSNQQCECVGWIPGCSVIQYRQYSNCIKHGRYIFCLPGYGKGIWYYDSEKSVWDKISINDQNRIWTCINAHVSDNSRIWIQDEYIGKIYEINLEQKVLEKEYIVPQYSRESVGEYIFVEDKIYSALGDRICCIDIKKATLNLYSIYGIQGRLHTIVYDGSDFWLSGYCKEIYIWNPEQGIKDIVKLSSSEIELLPDMQMPLFLTSISLGRYIWYIPFKTNEIIYVDKVTHQFFSLQIENEYQSYEEIDNNLINHKYLVEYVDRDRYIGIYSLKNQSIFEIDTVSLCVKSKRYALGTATMKILAEKCYEQVEVMSEKNDVERALFTAIFDVHREKKEKIQSNIGDMVFQRVK